MKLLAAATLLALVLVGCGGGTKTETSTSAPSSAAESSAASETSSASATATGCTASGLDAMTALSDFELQMGDAQKAGKITVPAVSYAKDREQAAKRIVCEVLTGLRTSEWRARFGRRIRDTLDPSDLLTYGSAFTLAVNLLQVRAATNEDALREQLGRLYGSRIDPAKYADLPPPAAEF